MKSLLRLPRAVRRKRKRSLLGVGLTVVVIAGVATLTGLILFNHNRSTTPAIVDEAEYKSLSGNAKHGDGGSASAFGSQAKQPTETPPSVPPPGSDSPSGEFMPVGGLPGWRQTFTEDFLINAPLGSWAAADNEAGKIVYTGATGAKWSNYPDGWPDTNGGTYRPSQVLSVHDGVLDYWLRNDANGKPIGGANPSPQITGGGAYQTYGRFSVRFRTDNPNVTNYYVAWLLWPQNEREWTCAESDYPEGGLGSGEVNAFHHNQAGCNQNKRGQTSATRPIDYTQWHTYTQEWMPGVRKYYLDSELIHTSTVNVYAKPERWQLQTETQGNGSGSMSGHLLLDWAIAYAYNP